MDYYSEIKNELINNETYKKVKDYSKKRSDLNTYYNVGKLLIEAQGGKERAKYGDGLIREYSKKLTNELNKKFNTIEKYKTILFSKSKKSDAVGQIVLESLCRNAILKRHKCHKLLC